MHRLTIIATSATLALCLLPAAPAAAAPLPAPAAAQPLGYHYFPQTGHSISGRVAEFYTANGGLPVFGLPLTEPLGTGAGQVQYFERARLDLLPGGIRIASAGRALAATRGGAAFTPAEPGPQDLDASGFTVDSIFRQRYADGGAARFGAPTSSAFLEDGRLVQYFERGRLEWTAEDGFTVGLVGHEFATLSGVDPAALAPVPERAVLASATMRFPAESRANVQRAADTLDGTLLAADAEASFLRLIGEVSVAQGYTAGEVVVKNEIGTSVGGGICYVATVVYRAALRAGLPIVERRGHSIAIESFQDWPGTDAAVDTTSYDLRWANDTGADLLLTLQVNGDSVTAQLLGQPDGRVVTFSAPAVDRAEPEPTRYEPDDALPDNSSKETTAGRPATTVTLRRVIQRGEERRTQLLRSAYASVQTVVRYGAGFTPPAASSTPSSPNSTPSAP